jgi:AraC family transcriptional regulator
MTQLVPSAKLLQSVDKLDFTGQFGFLPVVTSRNLNWKSLFAIISLSQEPGAGPVIVPAMRQDYIILHLATPVHLTAYLGNKTVQTESIPGEFSIVPRERPMKWQVSGGRGKVLVIFLQPDLLNRLVVETLDAETHFTQVETKVVIQDPLILQLSCALKDELEKQGFAGQLYVDSISQTLGLHLLRNYGVFKKKSHEAKGKLSPYTLRLVLDYIHENFLHDIRLTEIASLTYLSDYHFARLFKQTVGLPVYQYVLEKRMEYGKKLLLSGTHNVAQAALETGFADTSHFSRHFKRQFGISPGALIKKSKNIL